MEASVTAKIIMYSRSDGKRARGRWLEDVEEDMRMREAGNEFIEIEESPDRGRLKTTKGYET